MIARIWHGWTTPHNADKYEQLLKTEIVSEILGHIDGFLGIDILRRDSGGDVEFVTVTWFASMDAVRAFAGPDSETAVVVPKARALLRRFDDRAVHYEVRERRSA